MNLSPDSVIEERLVKTFPNARLRELARATGLIQCDGGKLEADALFWSLAIGFLSGNYRTLEEFRQAYIETFGGITKTLFLMRNPVWSHRNLAQHFVGVVP